MSYAYTQADRDLLVASFLDLTNTQIAETVASDDEFLRYLEKNGLDQYLADALQALNMQTNSDDLKFQVLYLHTMAGLGDDSMHTIVHRISDHCPLDPR